ncbi:hypothetical protein DDV96_13625 [Marixanthomonas spongiae]|uniref:Uncharacterized protein n=2 Tax=Marixanthomonas spongiae TaxID=2174845 RepID=A0A2U0HXD2_9FLAO|nr:hypothetical protein DDV96_13625 [Marixanthomonas spongiae]
MKNAIKKTMLLAFLAFAFVVSSCSEDDPVSEPTNSEAIEQGSELANLIQRTTDDKDNEAIDCIDFVYPLNFFIYNSNDEQIGTQTVNNDSELLTFLLSLENGTYVALDFPISVVLKDGTVVEVSSNAELLALIADCASGDGDGVPSDFETNLTSGSWFVTYFYDDDDDDTSDFAGYEFTFATDNTAQATNGSNTVNGNWNLTNSTIPDLELYFGENDPFEELDEDWDIIEATSEIIKLKHVSDDDDGDEVEFLTFERTPSGGGGNGETAAFVDNLTTNDWFVNLLEDDGENETCDYVAYQFTFNSDNTVVAASDNNTVNGTWTASNSSSGLELDLNFEIANEDDPFDDLNDDWDVEEYDANIIKLFDVSGGNGDTDFLTFGRDPYQDCNGGNTGELENVLVDGQWSVGSYIDDGNDETADYNGYVFTFNADGTATAANNNDTVNGTWDVQPSGSGLDLVLNFEIASEDDPFDDLNDDWDVEQFTAIQVDLKDVSGGNGGTDLLTFVKL